MHQLFAEYGSYHRDRRNRALHEIGIPLIVLGIMALLVPLRIGPIDVVEIIVALLFVFYLRIDVPSALVALAGYAVLYAIALRIPWWLALVTFVAGWILQFIGHAYEGKKPAFTTNLVHLLIGPIWIAALAIRRAGGYKNLTE